MTLTLSRTIIAASQPPKSVLRQIRLPVIQPLLPRRAASLEEPAVTVSKAADIVPIPLTDSDQENSPALLPATAQQGQSSSGGDQQQQQQQHQPANVLVGKKLFANPPWLGPGYSHLKMVQASNKGPLAALTVPTPVASPADEIIWPGSCASRSPSPALAPLRPPEATEPRKETTPPGPTIVQQEPPTAPSPESPVDQLLREIHELNEHASAPSPSNPSGDGFNFSF